MFAYTKLMQAMAAAGVVSATDPYFNLTTLLLNTSSTNGAQNNTFLDSSTNNFTITRNGNTTQGTFTPFSQTGWSNYFNGSSSLDVASNAALALGTGDFTYEIWLCDTATPPNSSNPSHVIGVNASGGGVLRIYDTGIDFNAYAVGSPVTYSVTRSIGVWYHLAYTRSGTTGRLFYNGSLVATGTDSNNYTSSSSFIIGSNPSTGQFYTGYASNARIVKGTALYTSSFTPSTTPLTAVSGTSLLTCQSNRFLDNSTNALAITVRYSTPSVQAFSPFAPTAAYDAAVVGGSGYFDGSGDYLVTPSNAAVSSTLLGSDFTIECWLYLTTYPGGGAPIWTNSTSNSDGFSSVYVTSSGTVALGKVGVNEVVSTATVVRNAWNHFATVRSGSTVYLYLNGAQIASGAASTYLNTSSAKPLQIGQSNQSSPAALTGYISGYRAVSSALYTGSTYTIPTTVPTAISGTTLLLNFTNAGIYDSTAKNVLETVGNAQVSTTQAKWGTTSMYFDGTGDWLIAPYSTLNEFGSGNLTIEMWINTSASGQYITLLSKSPSSFASGMWSIQINGATAGSGAVVVYAADNSTTTPLLSTTGASVIDNAWHHIAIVRNGSSWVLYIDGTSRATATWSGTIATLSGQIWVGADQNFGRAYTGYIDDLRITKGYARYTANFTAPSAAFPLL